ncbi:PadR family transcriptional regulator [Amycolatopsis suaedae]|uniref:PadR family transcriptional regulator n=1 Tax=Amycolatopsis suaedae TaxID=2510978 RepID=A0A4Q7J6X6_9PSEU|nr:helix-turn-helix transcriptional regulator [Amycolatopsis suaedae]RZQ62889.1 PadR family transcriptional regulator [Amycolatopsis suaedae]
MELLHERPMHPYEMVQLMRERHVDTRVKLKAGSLYHTVERLVAAELVEVVDTQREGRRPERTVYGLTEAGRDVYIQRARELVATVADERPDYLSGLAVLDDLGPKAALAELTRRITQLKSMVAADEVVLERLHEKGTPDIYWLDWRYLTAHRRFELEWTERLRDDLESGRIPFQHPPKDD